MPYPNEHACRLKSPESVKTMGSGDRDHNGKKYRVIFGKPEGGSGTVDQSYRYPISSWTAAEARAHCSAHNGILFEPASSERVETAASKLRKGIGK